MVDMKELNVSYTGTEANKLFFEPVFTDVDIKAIFRVMPNVTHKRKMQFVQELDKIVRSYAGCGFAPVGNTTITEREIEVTRCRADMKACWEDFKNTVLEELLNKGTKISDISGTAIESWLVELIQTAIKKDIFRLYFFGSTASADPAYQPVDGLWSVHIPALIASNDIPDPVVIPGTALTAGQGITYIREVVETADVRLKMLPANMKKIFVSGRVYERYMTDLESVSGVADARKDLIDGVPRLTFRGIEVVPMYQWDVIQAQDFATPIYNAILYTAPQNLVVATDIVTPAEGDLRMWVDEDSEEWKAKVRFKMGANYIHASLIQCTVIG